MSDKPTQDDYRRHAQELLQRARSTEDDAKAAELTEQAWRILSELREGPRPMRLRMRTKSGDGHDPGDESD